MKEEMTKEIQLDKFETLLLLEVIKKHLKLKDSERIEYIRLAPYTKTIEIEIKFRD